MLPEDKDSAYLWDMLDAARTVAQFTFGLTIEKYLKDRKLQFRVFRGSNFYVFNDFYKIRRL
jgi:uncharacterized protein with HEPN domain